MSRGGPKNTTSAAGTAQSAALRLLRASVGKGAVRHWRGLAHRLDHSVSLSVAECRDVEFRRHELGTVPWAPHRGRQLTTAQRAVEKVGGENRGLPPEGSAWFPSHELGLLLAQRTFGE